MYQPRLRLFSFGNGPHWEDFLTEKRNYGIYKKPYVLRMFFLWKIDPVCLFDGLNSNIQSYLITTNKLISRDLGHFWKVVLFPELSFQVTRVWIKNEFYNFLTLSFQFEVKLFIERHKMPSRPRRLCKEGRRLKLSFVASFILRGQSFWTKQ